MNKKLFIGVDEAGYGPNLGPMVVAATLWEAPETLSEEGLESTFAGTFMPARWKPDCTFVPLGDSKLLYKRKQGLGSLEAGLLTMLQLCDTLPDSLSSLLELVGSKAVPPPVGSQDLTPWYGGLAQHQVPLEIDPAELQRLSDLADKRLKTRQVSLTTMRVAVLDERRFNEGLERLGSKGQLLSQVTLQLVSELLDERPGAAEVFCDRQGGRTNYLPVLLDAMPQYWFQELGRQPHRCSYRTDAERRIDIHFSVGGDSFPPAGLASMLAKYVRERLMQVFNAFWQAQIPSLKPTAGYPVDALRFREEIQDSADRLNLPQESWWRNR